MRREKSLGRRREDDSLVLAGGANGEWTPHDMRRTGATMMEGLKVPPHVIDRCQNHALGGSKVRKAYLQHDYRDEMKAAWASLGSRLDAIMLELAAERRANGQASIAEDLVPEEAAPSD